MIDLITAGFLLVFAGLGVMVVSLLLEGGSTRGSIKGGGVVMVGPIPIIFGSDEKWGSIAIVLAMVLVVLMLLLFLV